MRIKQLRRVF